MRILAITLLTSFGLFGMDQPAMLPTSLTEQFVFEPGGLIEVRGHFSELILEGWDESQIEVTMTRRDTAPCCGVSLDDTVGYDARKKDVDHFVITADGPQAGPTKFHIRLPKQASVVIREPQRRLSITGVKGIVRIAGQKTIVTRVVQRERNRCEVRSAEI